MTSRIHPTAVLDPAAVLAGDVAIGPYAVIGPDVTLGSGTTVAAHAVIERNTRVGARCYVGVGSVLGSAPQVVDFRGEPTWLEIGDDTQIREYATLNRGSTDRGTTSVGRHCFVMSYVHVAHDCVLEDHVVLANGVQLAGHVHVEYGAVIGGLTPVHQFVRIGRHAFVGGGCRLPQDVPPFTRAAGNPIRLFGINTTGLARAGFDADARLALKRAYRLLFNSPLTTQRAVEQLRADRSATPEVAHLVEFVSHSERGVTV